MKFSLSIVLDHNGFIKKELMKFDTLEKLDAYTSLFTSSDEIRIQYQDVIDIFLKQFSSYLKDKKQKNGRICITYYDNQNNLRFVPIIYKQNKNLLKESSILKLIKKSLFDDNILLEISKRKRYLLSNYEKDLLKIYFNSKNEKNKKLFATNFYHRILNNSNRYLYLRSLINVCKLLDTNIKEYSKEDNLEEDKFNKFHLDDDLDMYLINLISSEDYQQIFNYFGLDELEAKSDSDIPIGIKKLKK